MREFIDTHIVVPLGIDKLEEGWIIDIDITLSSQFDDFVMRGPDISRKHKFYDYRGLIPVKKIPTLNPVKEFIEYFFLIFPWVLEERKIIVDSDLLKNLKRSMIEEMVDNEEYFCDEEELS